MADDKPTNGVLLARIDERVSQLRHEVRAIDKKLEARFVTKDQFSPVRRIVYGGVAVVLSAVALGVLALVVH